MAKLAEHSVHPTRARLPIFAAPLVWPLWPSSASEVDRSPIYSMKNLSPGPTLSPLDFSHTAGTMTSRFGIADDEHGESLQRTRRNSISWNA